MQLLRALALSPRRPQGTNQPTHASCICTLYRNAPQSSSSEKRRRLRDQQRRLNIALILHGGGEDRRDDIRENRPALTPCPLCQ